MDTVPNPSAFCNHDGNLRVPEGRKSLGDSEPFQDDVIDPEGWPEEDSDVGGTLALSEGSVHCAPCA